MEEAKYELGVTPKRCSMNSLSAFFTTPVSEHTHSARNIQKRQEWLQDRPGCFKVSLCLMYFILCGLSFLLWHPTNWACDKREVSTSQCQKWSLHNVMPMIIALHHSALYCQTWFPVYRDLAWQKYILRSSTEKKWWVSHIQVIFKFNSRRSFLGCWEWGISVSLSPSHFNLRSALGAINRQHFILTLISQIHSYCLAAVTLWQDKVSHSWLYSSTYSGSLTGEAMGCFVERTGEPEVMHS